MVACGADDAKFSISIPIQLDIDMYSSLTVVVDGKEAKGERLKNRKEEMRRR